MGLGRESQLFEKDTKLYNKVCVWKMKKEVATVFIIKLEKKSATKRHLLVGGISG